MGSGWGSSGFASAGGLGGNFGLAGGSSSAAGGGASVAAGTAALGNWGSWGSGGSGGMAKPQVSNWGSSAGGMG